MSTAESSPTPQHGAQRPLPLPKGWDPVEPKMYDTALSQAIFAFTDGTADNRYGLESVERYYDPSGKFSGATFLDVEVHDEYAVTAADLWAVTTLSMDVPPDAGRALMNPGPLRTIVNNKLRHLPPTLPLSDVTAEHLTHMWDLYHAVKTMLPALGERPTEQWVLASKLCARKRPMLFPVRDHKICTYLAGNPRRGHKPGRLGSFSRDLQVLGHLVAHETIRRQLAAVRDQMSLQHPTWALDWCDLRLLDAVVWMRAVRNSSGSTPGPEVDGD